MLHYSKVHQGNTQVPIEEKAALKNASRSHVFVYGFCYQWLSSNLNISQPEIWEENCNRFQEVLKHTHMKDSECAH